MARKFSNSEIIAALDKIILSSSLSNSPQSSSFLRYIVEQKLQGNQKQIKAYTIAIDALGKDETFDSSTNPLVRVQAVKLRKTLDLYYATHGSEDAFRIDIPKGTYVPEFIENKTAGQVPPKTELLSRLKHLGKSLEEKANLYFKPAAIGLVLILVYMAAKLVPVNQNSEIQSELAFSPPKIAISSFMVSEFQQDSAVLNGISANLSSELLHQFSRYPWLSIVANEADNFHTLNTHSDVIPDYVLEGYLAQNLSNPHKNSSHINIQVRLVENTTKTVKWTRSYDLNQRTQSWDAVTALLGQKISKAVGSENGILVNILQSAQSPLSKIDIECFRCFIGMYQYWKQPDLKNYLKQRNCLRYAVKLNPNYAEAWAALAQIYMDTPRFHKQHKHVQLDNNTWKQAQEYLEKALTLAPLNPIVLETAMRFELTKPVPDHFSFVRHAKTEMKMRPDNPEALIKYGNRLAVHVGKWQEGLDIHDRVFHMVPEPSDTIYLAPAFQSLLSRDDDLVDQSIGRLEQNESLLATILKLIAAHRTGEIEKVPTHKDTLRRYGIGSVPQLRDHIRRKHFYPELRNAVESQAIAAFQSA